MSKKLTRADRKAIEAAIAKAKRQGDKKKLSAQDSIVFAAEFLLESDSVMETIQENDDFFCASSLLCVPPELLDYKLHLMQDEGYLVNPPQIARSNFLKRDINRPYQV